MRRRDTTSKERIAAALRAEPNRAFARREVRDIAGVSYGALYPGLLRDLPIDFGWQPGPRGSRERTLQWRGE